MRKETVDIGILVTSRNGDRKIMQSIRITSSIIIALLMNYMCLRVSVNPPEILVAYSPNSWQNLYQDCPQFMDYIT